MLKNIIAAILVCMIAIIITYFAVPAGKRRIFVILTMVSAVVIRCITVFVIYQSGADNFGTDGLLYHREGIEVMKQLAGGTRLVDVKYSYTLYTVYVGIIYHIFGINRYLASYANILLALISGLILLKIALNNRYSLLNSSIIAAAFLYFPNLVLWTADTRKESLLILVCFLCWYSIQRLVQTFGRKEHMAVNAMRVLLICVLMWIGTLIRIYIFIPFLLGIIACFLLLYRKSRQKLCLAYVAAILICGALIAVTVLYPMTADYHAVSFSNEQSSDIFKDIAGKLDTLYNIVSQKDLLRSISDCLLQPNPARLDVSFAGYSENVQFLVKIDMVIWYVCLLLALTGIYSAIRRRDSYFIGLLTFISFYILINAFIAENVSDTVYRYRSAIVGLTILFMDGRIIRRLFERLILLIGGSPRGGRRTGVNYEALSLLQDRRNFM